MAVAPAATSVACRAQNPAYRSTLDPLYFVPADGAVSFRDAKERLAQRRRDATEERFEIIGMIVAEDGITRAAIGFEPA